MKVGLCWNFRLPKQSSTSRRCPLQNTDCIRCHFTTRRHSGARAKRANPESRDSPMCNCTSEVWSFGPSRNDDVKYSIPIMIGLERAFRLDADVVRLVLAQLCQFDADLG